MPYSVSVCCEDGEVDLLGPKAREEGQMPCLQPWFLAGFFEWPIDRTSPHHHELEWKHPGQHLRWAIGAQSAPL